MIAALHVAASAPCPVTSPAILRSLLTAARLTRQFRVLDVCEDCGCDPDEPSDSCHPHGLAIIKAQVWRVPAIRNRAAEMVTFAAREVLTVSDAGAADRAACRMVLDNNASPELGEQVVRAYQRLRRGERL